MRIVFGETNEGTIEKLILRTRGDHWAEAPYWFGSFTRRWSAALPRCCTHGAGRSRVLGQL